MFICIKSCRIEVHVKINSSKTVLGLLVAVSSLWNVGPVRFCLLGCLKGLCLQLAKKYWPTTTDYSIKHRDMVKIHMAAIILNKVNNSKSCFKYQYLILPEKGKVLGQIEIMHINAEKAAILFPIQNTCAM